MDTLLNFLSLVWPYLLVGAILALVVSARRSMARRGQDFRTFARRVVTFDNIGVALFVWAAASVVLCASLQSVLSSQSEALLFIYADLIPSPLFLILNGIALKRNLSGPKATGSHWSVRVMLILGFLFWGLVFLFFLATGFRPGMLLM